MKKVTKALLEKYYAGQCTPDETRLVEDWLNAEDPKAPQEQRVLTSVRQELVRLIDAEEQSEIRQMPDREKELRIRPVRYRIGVWSAAAALLLFAFSMLLYRHYIPEKATEAFTATTIAGQTKRITLKDGTIVTLNAGSELRYDANFGDKDRLVHLTGEAHFTVAKDKSRPFRVVTAHETTEVLGTVFNIKSYEETHFMLTVEEGKVRVTDDKGTQHILIADEQISWQDGQFIEKADAPAADYVAWKDKVMVFDDTPLQEVISTMERWYGVQITTESADLLQKTFTGRFDNPDLTNLLEDLSFSLKLTYTKDSKQKITLRESK